MSLEGSAFDGVTDYAKYFLTEDALECVSYDLYFSPIRKYYCGAGCKICYISDQLREMKPNYKKYVPEKITEEQTQRWLKIFDHFYVVRTNDDFSLLKKEYPHIFEWYKKNAHHFEFGMTDNSILSNFDILMNELNLKGLADVTLSEDFLIKTNNKGLVLNRIRLLFKKYSACQIKIIRTSEGFEHPKIINDLISYLDEYKLFYTIHHDLRNDNNYRYDLGDAFQDQNCYILSHNNRTYHIQRTTVNLFNDSFYYSFDDASKIDFEPFHVLDGDFDTKKFLSTMLSDKLKYYADMARDLRLSKDPLVKKFADYFTNVNIFKVNSDYNFIPWFMLHDKSKYYSKLVEYGFKKTSVGLYLPNEKPVPIIEYK